jgi:hypothetical protein
MKLRGTGGKAGRWATRSIHFPKRTVARGINTAKSTATGMTIQVSFGFVGEPSLCVIESNL